MKTLKTVLCVLAAMLLAECIPGPCSAFRGLGQEKATGLAAVAGGLTESVLSPFFWIVAGVIFALLSAASRLASRPLRSLFFWIPVTAISAVAVGFVALVMYGYLSSRAVH